MKSRLIILLILALFLAGCPSGTVKPTPVTPPIIVTPGPPVVPPVAPGPNVPAPLPEPPIIIPPEPPITPPVVVPAVSLSLLPLNPPEVPEGVFCTRSNGILAVVTGNPVTIRYEWFDVTTGTKFPSETNTLSNETHLLISNHVIKAKVTADGQVLEAQERIT